MNLHVGKEVWWPDTSPSNYGAQHGFITAIIDNIVVVRDEVEKHCTFYTHPIRYNTTEGTSPLRSVSDLYENEQEATDALRDPFTETFSQENEPGMWWWRTEEGDSDEKLSE